MDNRQIANLLGENIAFLTFSVYKWNESQNATLLLSWFCWKIYIQGLKNGKGSNRSHPRALSNLPSCSLPPDGPSMCGEDTHLWTTGDESWRVAAIYGQYQPSAPQEWPATLALRQQYQPPKQPSEIKTPPSLKSSPYKKHKNKILKEGKKGRK